LWTIKATPRQSTTPKSMHVFYPFLFPTYNPLNESTNDRNHYFSFKERSRLHSITICNPIAVCDTISINTYWTNIVLEVLCGRIEIWCLTNTSISNTQSLVFIIKVRSCSMVHLISQRSTFNSKLQIGYPRWRTILVTI